MCPPMWAHWLHLANMIELVLPSAHLSPQPKRQIDRFSRVCTADAECPRVLWRHLANTPIEIAHIGAIWWIRLNSCFLRPTRVLSPNGKSIDLAVSAQLTAESPYTLQCATLSPEITPSHWGSGPHQIRDSLGHSEITIQTTWWLIQPFSHRWLHNVPILYYGRPFFPKIAHSHRGILTPHLTGFFVSIPSPYSKWHLDRLCHFYTDDCSMSLYFTMGRPFPLKIAPSHGGSEPPI